MKDKQYIRIAKIVTAIQFDPALVLEGSGFVLPEHWLNRIEANQEGRDAGTTVLHVTTVKQGELVARKGDWIVEDEEGNLEVMLDIKFKKNYREARS